MTIIFAVVIYIGTID